MNINHDYIRKTLNMWKYIHHVVPEILRCCYVNIRHCLYSFLWYRGVFVENMGELFSRGQFGPLPYWIGYSFLYMLAVQRMHTKIHIASDRIYWTGGRLLLTYLEAKQRGFIIFRARSRRLFFYIGMYCWREQCRKTCLPWCRIAGKCNSVSTRARRGCIIVVIVFLPLTRVVLLVFERLLPTVKDYPLNGEAKTLWTWRLSVLKFALMLWCWGIWPLIMTPVFFCVAAGHPLYWTISVILVGSKLGILEKKILIVVGKWSVWLS